MSRWPGGDDALFEELREALAPVPARVLDAGRASFAWRTIDAELAALSYDSAQPPAADPATLRRLTFQSGDQSIELEAERDLMYGRLLPPRHGHVEVHRPDGSVDRSVLDAAGHFRLRLGRGDRFRLLCVPDTAASTITDWITL